MDALDAMSAVLRNFKSIPCPSGSSCTQPNCQWKHPWETEPAVTRSEEPAVPKSGATTTDEDADGGWPRKRQRVDEAGRDRRSNSQLDNKVEAATANKSVSPPPLKRKAPSQPPQTPVKRLQPGGASTPVSSTLAKPVSRPKGGVRITTATSNSISAPTSVNPSPEQQKTPKKAPRKPEPLNPRLLKTSPATHEFRYKVLRMLHEQLTRLNTELKKDANDEEEKMVLTDQELIWLALDKEEHAATDKPPIYSNVIKNRITAYKRMSVQAWKEERLAEQKKEAAAASTMPVTGPLLGPPRVVETGLTPEQEVAFLKKLVTPIGHLSAHRYVPIAPTEEAIEKARRAEEDSKGWESCDRCGSHFQVFPGRRESDGALTSAGKCTYHPGRRTRLPRTAINIREGTRPADLYACCQQDINTPGCTQSNTHVFKIDDPPRLALVMPYMETPANPSAPTDRAVCFDCEMGYTVRGFELLRLTATSWPDGKVILDVLVQPIGEILDFNSRYSGIFPEQFASAPPYSEQDEISRTSERDEALKEGEIDEDSTPKTVNQTLMKVSSPFVARDLLFRLISPSTPLIGHAIENDLGAVRIIHPTIIDTVLLFPHPRGMPLRHGLKALVREHLNKAIQVETDEQRGHDSAEDARAAGELVRFKVMADWAELKKRGWRVEGTELIPPGKGVLTETFIERERGIMTSGLNGVKN